MVVCEVPLMRMHMRSDGVCVCVCEHVRALMSEGKLGRGQNCSCLAGSVPRWTPKGMPKWCQVEVCGTSEATRGTMRTKERSATFAFNTLGSMYPARAEPLKKAEITAVPGNVDMVTVKTREPHCPALSVIDGVGVVTS